MRYKKVPIGDAIDLVCLAGGSVFGLLAVWNVIHFCFSDAIYHIVGFLILTAISTMNGILQDYIKDIKDEEQKTGTEGRGVSDLNCLLGTREIMFRGWDTANKTMTMNIETDYMVGEWAKDERYILMQFTGLKDKNGKEIYEADILDWYGKRHIIIYDRELAQFNHHAIDPDGYDDYFERGNNEIQEVIGNIFETPELLE